MFGLKSTEHRELQREEREQKDINRDNFVVEWKGFNDGGIQPGPVGEFS